MDNYEEKYNEALERAKEYHDNGGAHLILEVIFSELKESKDERIKREILELVSIAGNGNQFEEIKDWLEKQGIQPTDKVEPKFKVMDWITNGHYTRLIVGVNSRHYQFKNGDAKYIDDIDKNYHLWSIADAKDGDVLVASDGSIFLFAGVDDCACKYYAALDTDNYFKINKEAKGGYWETSRAVYPATKEQRDLLFKKMADAGYEWDGKKKELSKQTKKRLRL